MSAIYYNIEQGSEEWAEARRGIVTASGFHRLITPTGRPATGEKPKTYLAELIADRIEIAKRYYGEWMERGHDLEADAVTAYELINDISIQPMGVIYKDATFSVSCSPDGLVGKDGGIEIKSLMLANHIKHLLADTVPPEHIMQCHGSMWVTGRQYWDFISHHPSTKTLIKRVERDEKIMRVMDDVIPEFIEQLEQSSAFVLGYEYRTNQLKEVA